MMPMLFQVQTDSREIPRIAATVEDAMRHVLVVMRREGLWRTAPADELAQVALDTFAYLGDARPNLAHVLFKEAEESRDPSLVILHDPGVQPGEDSVRLVTVLMDEQAPSLALMKALVDVVGWKNDPEDAATELVAEIEAMTRVRPGHPADAILRRMRDWQDAFGHPEGHPLRVVPDPVPGETPSAVLEGIADLAARRLMAVAASVERATSPNP